MAAEADKAYPSTVVAWSTVLLLTSAYVLSFVDRYILNLLIEPIKADLGFTDSEIGLLTGVAFGFLYATAGLPIGWLADRKRRTWIVAAGVFIWSAATALTGLAKSFWTMFVARMHVALGEATLSPCTMSMISDSFPPASRGKPIAFYTMALSLGAGIANLLAAAILQLAERYADVELPVVGALQPWQWVFVVLGLPGVLLAIVFVFMTEPTRIEQARADADEGSGFSDMLQFVSRSRLAYFSVVGMAAAMVITAYSQGWMAAAFERTWGWDAKRYAAVNGIILLAIGPASVLLAGFLSDRLYAAGRRDGPYLIMLIGTIIMVPTAALAMVMPTPELAFVMIAFSTVGIALVSAVGPTALVNVTPGAVRGQTIALYYMFISLTGLFIGQYVVGVMSDHVFGNENLRYAIAVIPVIFGIPALLLSAAGRSAYNRALASKQREREAASA